MLTVVLGLAVLSVLVVIHELGHLVVARSLGVRVERFSVGFGPVLFSRRVRGVEVAVSAFPLGGYVKMGGDDPRRRDLLQPGDFFAAAWWRRVLIALAGPGANFVLAVVLGVVLLWSGVRVPDQPNVVGAVAAGSLADSLGFKQGDRITQVGDLPTASLQAVSEALDRATPEAGDLTFRVERDGGAASIRVPRERLSEVFRGLDFPVPPVVGEVVLGTPAYKSGLKVGDRILAVDGSPVEDFAGLQELVSGRADQEIRLTVERDGQTIELPITPFGDASGGTKVGKIGITAASTGTYVIRRSLPQALVEGTVSTVVTAGAMIRGIGSLFTDVSNLSQISGPVAIIQASGDAARAGFDRLVDRAILFSIALMVFNLLPIPILDGGMVVLSVLEGARRKPVGNRGLAVYQGIGLAVMGTLLLFVLINDPLRILQRRSALDRIEAP